MSAAQEVKLKISERATLTWHPIGDYGTSVLQVDDFLDNPDQVRELALTRTYEVLSPEDFYPGLRCWSRLGGDAAAASWVAERILSQLFPHGAYPPGVRFQGGTPCIFCVMNLDALNVPENFYEQHADSQFWVATVLHLSSDDAGRGTAFWEHRPSGLQHWSRADPVLNRRLEASLGLRLSEQLDAAFAKGAALFDAADIKTLLARKPGRRPFSAEEDEDWRLLKFVPARYNRLIAYPSWQIHSIVDECAPRELTLQNMRLTLNQFLKYPLKSSQRKSPYRLSAYRPVQGLSVAADFSRA